MEFVSPQDPHLRKCDPSGAASATRIAFCSGQRLAADPERREQLIDRLEEQRRDAPEG